MGLVSLEMGAGQRRRPKKSMINEEKREVSFFF